MKKIPIDDTDRLNKLIELCSDFEFNSDFEQMLFFARQGTLSKYAAFKRALDEWIIDER